MSILILLLCTGVLTTLAAGPEVKGDKNDSVTDKDTKDLKRDETSWQVRSGSHGVQRTTNNNKGWSSGGYSSGLGSKGYGSGYGGTYGGGYGGSGQSGYGTSSGYRDYRGWGGSGSSYGNRKGYTGVGNMYPSQYGWSNNLDQNRDYGNYGDDWRNPNRQQWQQGGGYNQNMYGNRFRGDRNYQSKGYYGGSQGSGVYGGSHGSGAYGQGGGIYGGGQGSGMYDGGYGSGTYGNQIYGTDYYGGSYGNNKGGYSSSYGTWSPRNHGSGYSGNQFRIYDQNQAGSPWGQRRIQGNSKGSPGYGRGDHGGSWQQGSSASGNYGLSKGYQNSFW